MEEINKLCPCCRTEKTIDKYGKQKSTKDGISRECKECLNERASQYRRTLNGQLHEIFNHARKNAKDRKNNNRGEAGKFEIEFIDLEDLFKKQDGKCYYSRISMNFDRNDWKISLERKDPNLGYIKDNIALACIEFNSISQWTLEKIQEMLSILDQNILDNFANFEINTERKKSQKVIKSIIDGIEYVKCNKCNINKLLHDFSNILAFGCTDCRKKKKKDFLNSPRGTLQQLLDGAKKHTRRREGTKIINRDNSFDIDLKFLIDKFKEQKGLCYYSGIPLKFGSYLENNWKTSLERIDVFKGYTRDNVCLICLEFQGSDKSVLYNDNTLGNSGWTKEKFQYFLDKIKEK
jgi:hypothetical protein